MVLSRHLVGSTVLAGVVLAAPQRPDFAAINAAPSVANGPSLVAADDNGVQTATLATRFAITGAATATGAASKREIQVRDTLISSDKTDSAYNAQFGAYNQLTTIQQGTSYWINGGSTHNFYGNINNNGRIFVSQTQYLQQNKYAGGQTSDWVGHDVNNGNLNNAAGALIQLNDYGSISAPTYDWYIRSIKNNGTFQWCGRGDTGGSTFQMYSDQDAINNGLVSFEQFFSNIGASFVWRNPTLTTTNTISNLYNNGAFRIINVVYHNVQNVYGTGCWQIGKGGVLYLEDGTGVFQNPTGGPSFPGQSITFQDSSAVLHMDTAVYSRNSNFGAQIYGFGTGNAIEFYQTIKSFSYSNGVLNVAFVGGNQVNIKIGSGYDASRFVNKKNPQKYNVAGYNAIFYNGAAPSQSVPSQCGLTAPVCSDLSGGLPPISGPSTSSAVVSSTSSSAVPTTTSKSSSAVPSIISSTTKASSSPSAIPSTTSKSSSSAVSTSSSAFAPPPTTLSSASPTSKVSSSSAQLTTSAASTTTKARKTCPYTPYAPYYPALATGYTTFPGTTSTTDAAHPCPTTPEEGTYCGFLNPLDPCGPQPDGYGPTATPDTPSAFLAFDKLHAMASAAPSVIPSIDNTQYTQVFKDLNAGVQGQSYLGQYTLQTYNTTECAGKCDCTDLCTSFNLWAERDPSLAPSANDSTYPTVWGYDCPNPNSMTSFKCTLWGSDINSTMATNDGQWREQFHIVITASDGWTRTNVTVPPTYPSWNPPANCKGKAIDAPDNHLGSHFFPGPFNADVCQDFASKQGQRNAEAGAPAVKMFNAYYLHKNGKPHGTYCTLYDTDLDAGKYATYSGENVNGDQFTCVQSWKFGKSS